MCISNNREGRLRPLFQESFHKNKSVLFIIEMWKLFWWKYSNWKKESALKQVKEFRFRDDHFNLNMKESLEKCLLIWNRNICILTVKIILLAFPLSIFYLMKVVAQMNITLKKDSFVLFLSLLLLSEVLTLKTDQ